jgi:hypothetical protein
VLASIGAHSDNAICLTCAIHARRVLRSSGNQAGRQASSDSAGMAPRTTLRTPLSTAHIRDGWKFSKPSAGLRARADLLQNRPQN